MRVTCNVAEGNVTLITCYAAFNYDMDVSQSCTLSILLLQIPKNVLRFKELLTKEFVAMSIGVANIKRSIISVTFNNLYCPLCKP